MSRRLLMGIGWASVGSAVYAGSQWGILIVVANLGEVTDVGVLSLAMAVAAPIFLLFGLNLRVAQATDSAGQFSFQDYVAVRAITTALALGVLLIVVVTWSPIRAYWLPTALVGLAKVAEAMTEVVIGRLHFLERLDLIGKLQISRGLAAFVSFSVAFFLTDRLDAAIAAWAFAWLALLFSARLHLSRFDSATEHKRSKRSKLIGQYWPLVVAAAPLGLVAVMDSLVVNIPKYALQGTVGIEQVGVFSAIAYLMTVGGIVVGAIGYAVTPRFAKLGLNNYEAFRGLMVRALTLGLAIGVFGILSAGLFGERLLSLIYSTEFSSHSDTFLVVMIAATLWYLSGLLGCGINGLRDFGTHAVVQFLALVGVSVSSALLIPSQGAYGAAWAMTIGMGVRVVAAGVALKWALRGSLRA